MVFPAKKISSQLAELSGGGAEFVANILRCPVAAAQTFVSSSMRCAGGDGFPIRDCLT